MARHLATLGLAAAAGLVLGGLGAAPAFAEDVDMAKAKQEGTVVWYTSTPIEQANKLARLFEDQTGIKVELFRSGGSAILRRFYQELSAGRVGADVLTTSDPAASNVMAEKGTFVPFKPVGFDKIPDAAKDPDGNWIGQRLNLITIYMRGDKVAEADRPQKWTDLTDPKYKGQMVMTDPSFTSLQLSVVGTLSQKLGWDFYQKLADNDIMIVQGNQQVSDNLKRGERLIAVGALDSYAAQDRLSGHEIVTVYPKDGTFVIPSPTAVVKGSDHPNAAKAFAAFMISPDAQKIFPADGGYSARIDVDPPEGGPKVSDLTIIPVDYAALEKQASKIKDQFNDIFR
ncbi:ABC transporter substrate-binding protein [Ancylobacter mangrovi]|uniref:ABC transporter substrate-binding protein n=1 Tax=Ancylobacter mangrovi TaxID=2972472 RepID=UPI002161319C|nr:ABC transporter substrate-binding protein [Ancylobacter mangrovi]MCS0502477.1 ABC transporter substrate-binding protein [Ancylobacter mangrovi]